MKKSPSNSTFCSQLAPWAWLFLRVAIAAIFIQQGWAKFQNPSVIQGMLNGIGVPLSELMGWVVLLSELIGGTLLLLGLWTRYATLPLMAIMLVAFFTVHLKDGLKTPTWLVILMFFGLAIFCTSGAGEYSLDRRLSKK
jgi:putative oxidoreductase